MPSFFHSLPPLLIASYLLGSIPCGLLIARMRGVDIRKVGSGNIGATNVLRTLGKPWGILAFLCDFLKGLAPALIGARLLTIPEGGLYCGVAAIIGHNWPIWLKFKGGKGIATTAGVLAGAAPHAIWPALIVWYLTFQISRFVSLASIFAAIAMAGAGWFFYPDRKVLASLLTVLALLAIIRHHANIRRLIRGEESRFTRKSHNAHQEST